MPDPPSRLCSCGHDREAHEHYRAGTDCGLCPRGGCTRFSRRRTPSLLAALRGLLSGAVRND